MLAKELMEKASPRRIAQIRSAYEDYVRSKTTRSVTFWGLGLLVFSSHRIHISRAGAYQLHRTLPTLAVDHKMYAARKTINM